MAPAAVRFHPAAAQEAESTYDWYAARDLPWPAPFAKSCGTQSMPSLRTRSRGHVMDRAPGDTYSRAFRSAWCIGCAVTTSKSSLLRTVGAGRATGGRAFEGPSNFRMQRPALRAAADPARYANEWAPARG
jgi:hypothetical protein